MRKGSPLAMLVLLMALWVGGRAMIWENPFPSVLTLPGAELLLAEGSGGDLTQHGATRFDTDIAPLVVAAFSSESTANAPTFVVLGAIGSVSYPKNDPARGFGHELLWLQALGAKLPLDQSTVHMLEVPEPIEGVTPISPPLESGANAGRWSFDAWGFWRQGSDSAAISQGRVPIYGASQVGANLQYRFAPSSVHDPRAYMRAYRALVTNGETEAAVGASARPFGAIPVRVAGEVRVTDRRFGTDIRPAIIATTELPPQQLPAGFRLEAYGGGGYVGGNGATPFVDGQIAVTREIANFQGPADTRARLSVGAGSWGGAQNDASRLDVGPTMRLDLTLGKVPARLSVDWRERVGGDASPDSGIAATLSTRF